MKPKRQRLILVLSGFVIVGCVLLITLVSLSESLIFFYTPSHLTHTYIHREKRIRVGGTVVPGSLTSGAKGISFTIKDKLSTLDISYEGILPDLFREGQAIVAEGYLERPDVFKADSVLAKHDETYRPKELQDSP